MAQHKLYTISELEEMFPFEKSIYFDLLVQSIKEENDRIHKTKQEQ